MSITFSHPQYLLLLPLVLGYTWWVMRGSLADLGRTRARLAMGLRILLLLLLVLGLAGIQLVRPTTTLCTVFVVDVSDSIATSERKVVLDYIHQAVKHMKSGDRAALVAFGAESLLDHAPEDRAVIKDIVSIPTTSRTDIAAGIQLAMATFPHESGKQIVLFSDGNENLGNAVEQAGLAQTSDVRISVVPLARDVSRGEALIARMESPQQVKEGAPFQVSVLLESLKDTEGRLTLYRNNEPTASRAVQLKAGKTVATFEQSVPKSGVYRFHAILDVPAGQDTVPDNNLGFAYTRVAGKPRLLIVEGTPGDGRYLSRSMRASDLEVELGGPDRIPTSLAECAHYDSIVFANVPAWRMSPAQMAIIRSAVRDTGMGFAMIGGEESFGAGGYYKTPVEDALPVTMDIKKQKTLPSMTLLIVIDISGSMGATEDGVPKIRLASEAAAAAVELLQPIDKICVVGYDTGPVVTVPMSSASNKSSIINQVFKLQPGGGGIVVHPALEDAYQRIRSSDTQIKHVILCADACDTEAYTTAERLGAVEVARKMQREKISLSVIGFGTMHDPDIPLQQDIARGAGGNWYLAERLSNLPQIFTRDVMFAAKSLLVEEPFRVRPGDASHPAIQGIGWQEAPPLLGYVATSPRDLPSRLLLTSHKDDPVMAAGPYGLGRSLAFTSDATAHWGAHWLGWEGYSSMWAQSLRWTLRQSGKSDFHTSLVEEGGRVKVVVEAVTGDGEFRNLLDLRAHIAHVGASGLGGPQTTRELVSLEQTAPGHYEASFESRDTGAYMVTIEERDGKEVKSLQNLTMVIPYSPEYQALQPNLPLLQQVADQAKGKFRPIPADIFGKLRFGSRTLQSLWPLLLLLLTIIFLLDVAIRRVLLPWDEIIMLIHEAIATRLPAWRTAGNTPVPNHTPTLGPLLNVKDKTRVPQVEEQFTTGNLRTVREQAHVQSAKQSTQPITPKPAGAEKPKPTAPASTASSLLQKKRERSGK